MTLRKLYVLSVIALLALIATVANHSSARAQDEVPPPSTPGIVHGSGVYFEVTDSEWLNVTLQSSAPIDLSLTSSPEIILMEISAASETTLVDISLSGLAANTTYWRYDNNEVDGVMFTADEAGSYEFPLDLSSFQTIHIQSGKSTYTIVDDGLSGTGYQCGSIGSWDGATKTCTLNQDVYDSINLYSAGVTLNGAGYTVYLPVSGRVYVSGNNHTITNLTIDGEPTCSGTSCSYSGQGLLLGSASNTTVSNVNITETFSGIYLTNSDSNVIEDNEIYDVSYGFRLDRSDNNTIQSNEISSTANAYYGLINFGSNSNTITENTMSDFNTGVYIYGYDYTYNYWLDDNNYTGSSSDPSSNNEVYRNDFLNVSLPIYLDQNVYTYSWDYFLSDGRHYYGTSTSDYSVSIGNLFNLPAPDGGNYYSQFDEPAEGCSDTNSDGFCDNPFIRNYAVDNLPHTAQVNVTNQAPTAEAGGPYEGGEGSAIALSGAGASDDDGDSLTYSWAVDDDTLCAFDNATILNPNLTCTDNGNFVVTLTVDDGTETTSDTANVTVNNVAPAVGDVTVPADPIDINNGLVTGVNAPYSDAGSNDTHTCTIDYGDGTPAEAGTTDGSSCSDADGHAYGEAGVYTVEITVTDDDSESGSNVSTTFIVIYDPDGGFVTGGGWIDSLEGAYADDPGLTGKATFGFVAKYKKGADEPVGNTQFQFKAGDLNFHSGSYDWLVVTGHKAMYKGEGELNGAPGYGFMLSAIDEAQTPSTDVDMFRIKIWEMSSGEVVYDNNTGAAEDADPATAIGGGSIVIHTRG